MAPAGAISGAGEDTSATVGAMGAAAAASAAPAADSAASAASFRRLAPLPLPVVECVVAGTSPPTHTTIVNAFDLLLETLAVYVLGLCLPYAVRNVVRKTPPGRRVRSSDVGGWGAFFAFGGPGVRRSVNYHSHKRFCAGVAVAAYVRSRRNVHAQSHCPRLLFVAKTANSTL